MAICKPEREPSPDTRSVGILTLDSSASRTMRKNVCWLITQSVVLSLWPEPRRKLYGYFHFSTQLCKNLILIPSESTRHISPILGLFQREHLNTFGLSPQELCQGPVLGSAGSSTDSNILSCYHSRRCEEEGEGLPWVLLQKASREPLVGVSGGRFQLSSNHRCPTGWDRLTPA